jgi:hypothetical protein
MVDQATVVLPVLLDDCQIPKILSSIIYFDLRHDRQSGIKKVVKFFKKETEGSARSGREGQTSDQWVFLKAGPTGSGVLTALQGMRSHHLMISDLITGAEVRVQANLLTDWANGISRWYDV